MTDLADLLPPVRRRSSAPGLLGVGIAAGAALAWGTLVERRLFTLRHLTVPVLPAGAAPIRVLHLSDLHMAPWQRDKQEWVASLAVLEPDLIVTTGDNMGHVNALEGLRAAFDPFRGVPGVFVWGSNDYFGPVPKNPLKYFMRTPDQTPKAKRLDIAALEEYFDDLGWLNLNNAAGQFPVRGTHLEFFGVDDPHRHYDRLDLLTRAIDDMEADDELADETWPDPEVQPSRSTLTIGLTHAPYQRVLNSFVNHGAELIFAGHTHGGQVCLPGFGALVTNCDIPRKQVKGLSLWRHGMRSAWLHVSAGLGTSIYSPVRFSCPPEASLLTLVPAP